MISGKDFSRELFEFGNVLNLNEGFGGEVFPSKQEVGGYFMERTAKS